MKDGIDLILKVHGSDSLSIFWRISSNLERFFTGAEENRVVDEAI
jgi:hypothetical protein